MPAYYNEKDANAAAWLRTLIVEGHVAPGEVDERSIVDVRPADLAGFEQCHFFAGIGGWSLALRLDGWPDTEPVWTGSCPCQPFSAAGRRKGFDDDRHLWPEFRRLIAERRPAIVFGEQVAGASEWLRLVRGDLEAMEYAVGAMPIQAASAGADHLRDRFWFVANAPGARSLPSAQSGIHFREEGPWSRDGQSERRGDTGDAGGAGLAFRSIAEVERADLRHQGAPASASGAGSFTVADADESQRGLGNEQPARQQPEQQSDPSSRDCSDLSDAERERFRGERPEAADRAPCGMQGEDGQRERLRSVAGTIRDAGSHEWVIGADGKARRVKSGVRLLVDGFPHRVGLLRGFGNAIDPRPAAAFIGAAREAMNG